jgi:hypothetical protein
MSMTLKLDPKGDLHKMLVKNLTSRIKMAESKQNTQHTKWKKAEDAVLAYVPESELDAKRRTQREQAGKPTYLTMKIPYSYALLMTAHTYWTSVFLARTPVHQFAGRHGETEQQVQAIEALIAYQVEVGNMLPVYYLWFYDVGKYGVGIIGEYWDREVINYSELTSQVDPETGKPVMLQVTSQVLGYQGTKLHNVSPWDFLPDPRVPVSNFQRGEFVAIKREISWNDVIRRKAQGYYMNTEFLATSAGTGQADTSRSQLLRADYTDMTVFDGMENKHPAVLFAYETYVDLIPNEWGLSKSNYPEKWVFTITRDLSTIIGAQPCGYAHGQFPFSVLEQEVEGYGLWNRGIPEQVAPIEETMNWLLNSHFYNVRAVLNNNFIADPTKLVLKDFQNNEAGLMIRMKPEAFGQDIRTFFQQIPVQDVTRNNIADIQVMLGIGERTTGINDALMGMMNGGGRKTATEVRSATGFGINRLKTVSEYMSATGFSSHARRLVQQSQQYYDTGMKLKLVGDIAEQDGGRFAMVTPEMIAGSYDFTPVDGTLPIDRMAQTNMWKEILMGMQRIPQIGMTFDMAKIFSYMARLAGVRNINQFKLDPKQAAMNQIQAMIAPDEQLAGEAKKGNLVPLRPKQSDNRTTGLRNPEQRTQ